MTLNGWQRIWVVVTVILLFLVLGVAWLTSPTPTGHDALLDIEFLSDGGGLKRQVRGPDGKLHVFPSDATDAEIREVLLTESILTEDERKAAMDRWMKSLPEGLSEDQFNKLRDKEVDEAIQAAAHAKRADQAKRWTMERRRHFLLAILLWVVFAGSLYALGWSVGWVRRGFKSALM